MDAALLARYENALRPAERRWDDWTRGQMAKIDGVLDQLEAEVKSLKGKPTLGSIAVGCALGYLDFRFANEPWRPGHPQLDAWYAKVLKLPPLAETMPKG